MLRKFVSMSFTLFSLDFSSALLRYPVAFFVSFVILAKSTMAQSSMGIGLVSLLVHNYDEAITFFVDKLGFSLTEDSPATSTVTGSPKRWVVVHPPGTAISSGAGILLAQAVGEEQKAVVGNQWGGRVGLFLRVKDFDAQYQRMKAAGVLFVGGSPREEVYGKVVVFQDLSGNKWDLIGPA